MTGKAALDVSSPFGTYKNALIARWVWGLCEWHSFPQNVRQKMRKHIARKFTGPFDVVYEGMKFRLYPAENYCDRVIFGRGDLPEKAEHQALLPLLKSGMVFVDIGGNVGSYSAFVGHRLAGECTLVALEPHPRTFQKLVFNLQANNLSTDHVVNCGAGSERGELDLWSDGGSNIGHTSMLKAGTSNAKVSVKVPVVPLIDLLRERNIEQINILKIDIEGFEDRALAPFFEHANESLWPDHILIETAHADLWERDIMETLRERGYEQVFATAENRLLTRKVS